MRCDCGCDCVLVVAVAVVVVVVWFPLREEWCSGVGVTTCTGGEVVARDVLVGEATIAGDVAWFGEVFAPCCGGCEADEVVSGADRERVGAAVVAVEGGL